MPAAMRSRVRHVIGISLAVVLCIGIAAPAYAHDVADGVADRAETADLGSALSADGTFLGAPFTSGTVDADAWSLVSDLAAGEPPRFGPTDTTRVDPQWSALGSNGLGNGALNATVLALAVSGKYLYV